MADELSSDGLIQDAPRPEIVSSTSQRGVSRKVMDMMDSFLKSIAYVVAAVLSYGIMSSGVTIWITLPAAFFMAYGAHALAADFAKLIIISTGLGQRNRRKFSGL